MWKGDRLTGRQTDERTYDGQQVIRKSSRKPSVYAGELLRRKVNHNGYHNCKVHFHNFIMLYFIVFFSNVTHCVYILFYLKQIVLENIMFSVKSLWDIKPNFRCSFDIGELIDELSVKWTDYENDVMRREDLKRIHQLVLILSCCKFWI